MKYRDGYRMTTTENEVYATDIIEQPCRLDPWLHLNTIGYLHISAGYAWDGPSIPWHMTCPASAVKASLVHDALYQLMRARKLSADNRPAADALFRRMLREGGMGRVRAWYWYRAVRAFGGKSATESDQRNERWAP